MGAAAQKMGVPSFARPPRPREDYSRSRGWFPPQYGGRGLVVTLEIDADGSVTSARLVRGLGVAQVDDHVVELSRDFKFWPALDDVGQPIPVRLDWLFVLPGNPVAEVR